MEYLLMPINDSSAFAALSPSQQREGIAAYAAFMEAMGKAGVLRDAKRLRPAETATTVRIRSGKSEVQNGPYAETREQLGGYFLIDVPDLDAALAWAARCPAASHGAVEVRPIWPQQEM
ncbi:YciI family protein [Piscinibacter sp. XHJ-5]|uniref:YciI family protein n=1 Tax=Piscinibacter sp. XHJ-5 TaxID=3037797 RepID=UPI0024536304|nr:YciI family protein [Piscinibacter sp. XHJ-5]